MNVRKWHPVFSKTAIKGCALSAVRRCVRTQRADALPLAFFLLLILTTSCTFLQGSVVHADEPDKGQVEYFEKHVRPLFSDQCCECHDKENGPDNGGLVLDSVAGIIAGGSRGRLFDTTDPEGSLLIQAITFAEDDLQMPPAGKMSEKDINIILKWLRDGAIMPKPDKAVSHRPATKDFDWDAAKTFWSFLPLADIPVPVVKNDEWIQRPIDAFVQARLEQKGVSHAAPAERRTLLRRLSFDVIGLPPTVDELEAYLADTSEEAFIRQVDRLLASPHYGERWARMWLDLARYTDFTPDWQSPTDRGWMYRDWVVKAFNDNMSYDRFVRLQLAADLIPDTPPADLAALGFLGLSPTYWKELKLAPAVIEQIVADEWDERIDAVSRTFLGLTVSCARCHDHKFDPVTTADYYALAGVFASSQLHEQPLLPDVQATAVIQARRQLQSLEAKLKAVKDKETEEARSLQRAISELRAATPQVDQPFAHTLREASLYVVPDGPDATKLEYREHETRDLPIFQRGNPTNPGPVMPRRYLQVFLPGNTANRFEHGSGRGDLTDAMLIHSEGLMARVIVNRIWAQHFGFGLVRTPSDFGHQGDAPTHPELLEYLAFQFVEQGWDIKWLHREILLSATWQQSAAFRDEAFSVDPENKLLWRMNRRKLDFEQWRDAILSVTGQLDLTMGGPSRPVDDLSNLRRTLYVTVAREELHPVLRMHDFPEASAHSPARSPTTTPLQQLFVLNSPWMEAQASALWNRVSTSTDTDDTRIQFCYQLLFGRMPNEQEQQLAADFTGSDAHGDSDLPDQQKAVRWTDYLQALLGVNEFCFVE